MKTKLLILCLFVLLMTGCNVNYTIEIKDKKVIENFDISETDVEKANYKIAGETSFQDIVMSYNGNKELLTSYDMLNSETGCSSCKTYNKNTIISDEEIALIFTTEHTFEEYKDSAIANEYLPGFNVEYDDEKITISGGTNWNFLNDYEYLDEVVITVKTDYEVTSTNAEKESSGVYVWRISKDKQNKSLSMIINTTKKSNDINSGTNPKMFITILLVLLLIILFSLLVVYSLFQKKRNLNRL